MLRLTGLPASQSGSLIKNHEITLISPAPVCIPVYLGKTGMNGFITGTPDYLHLYNHPLTNPRKYRPCNIEINPPPAKSVFLIYPAPPLLKLILVYLPSEDKVLLCPENQIRGYRVSRVISLRHPGTDLICEGVYLPCLAGGEIPDPWKDWFFKYLSSLFSMLEE
jgi:hypothetical protein